MSDKNNFNTDNENTYPYSTKTEIQQLKGKIKQLENTIIKQKKKNRELHRTIRNKELALKFSIDTLNETLEQNKALIKQIDFMKRIKTIETRWKEKEHGQRHFN